MAPETHTKLLKLLMLTTSSTDQEALLAIRMANAILQKEGLIWSQMSIREFVPGFTYDRPPPWKAPPKPPSEEEEIEDMFDYINEHQPDWFDSTFTDDLYEKWEDGRRLTTKQLAGLKKVYNMLKEKE